VVVRRSFGTWIPSVLFAMDRRGAVARREYYA